MYYVFILLHRCGAENHNIIGGLKYYIKAKDNIIHGVYCELLLLLLHVSA